jgi:hypothetical protein
MRVEQTSHQLGAFGEKKHDSLNSVLDRLGLDLELLCEGG